MSSARPERGGKPETSLRADPARLRSRRSPEQARGRLAVERILEATAQLLEEFGYDRVTTVSIAKRAQVNIATLYRYYPNKYAVLAALAMRYDRERAESVAQVLKQLPYGGDWRSSIEAAIDEAARQRDRQKGGRVLRHALQSSPQLWQIDHAMTRRVASVLAEGMRALRPSLGEPITSDLALIVVATVTALLDLGSDPVVDQTRIRSQITDLVERYLAPYFS